MLPDQGLILAPVVAHMLCRGRSKTYSRIAGMFLLISACPSDLSPVMLLVAIERALARPCGMTHASASYPSAPTAPAQTVLQSV